MKVNWSRFSRFWQKWKLLAIYYLLLMHYLFFNGTKCTEIESAQFNLIFLILHSSAIIWLKLQLNWPNSIFNRKRGWWWFSVPNLTFFTPPKGKMNSSGYNGQKGIIKTLHYFSISVPQMVSKCVSRTLGG